MPRFGDTVAAGPILREDGAFSTPGIAMRLIVLSALLTLTAGAAHAADARCEIASGGQQVEGACDFKLRRGGSFDIRMNDSRPMGGAVLLSLDITAPGRGEVRGLTAHGVNSRWGPVTRRESDRACWDGADFAICVRPADGASPTVFAARCHMDGCSWVEQSPARDIAQGSAAVPGREVEVLQRRAASEHPGGNYPDSPPAGIAWSNPVPMRFFCSMARPAFFEGGAWVVLPLPEVFGATEGVTRMYLRACHPGADDDPYAGPVALGYHVTPPTRDYPDLKALVTP